MGLQAKIAVSILMNVVVDHAKMADSVMMELTDTLANVELVSLVLTVRQILMTVLQNHVEIMVSLSGFFERVFHSKLLRNSSVVFWSDF